MDFLSNPGEQNQSLGVKIFSLIGRVLLAISIPLIAFFVLYQGFIFLRDSSAPQIVITLIAIVWGVGGVDVGRLLPTDGGLLPGGQLTMFFDRSFKP